MAQPSGLTKEIITGTHDAQVGQARLKGYIKTHCHMHVTTSHLLAHLILCLELYSPLLASEPLWFSQLPAFTLPPCSVLSQKPSTCLSPEPLQNSHYAPLPEPLQWTELFYSLSLCAHRHLWSLHGMGLGPNFTCLQKCIAPGCPLESIVHSPNAYWHWTPRLILNHQ